MKHRMNQILLAAFFLTAALYVYFLLVWIEGIPRPFYDPADPFRFYEMWAHLFVGFHAAPCFCLQLLVCRTAKRLVARLIPVLLLLGIAACFTVGFFTASGWDTLGWGILLVMCIAPATGYAAGWAVYGIQRARQHNNH